MPYSYNVITIAQQKGGAGKTTLTAHLAIALSQKGLKVAVIDIDPQGSLTAWHTVREKRFGEGYTGIHFSNLSGWKLQNEISRLKREYDIILVDTPPHTQSDAKTAIRAADIVMIPVQPSPMDLWATQETIDLATAEKRPYFTVLNRVNANSKMAKEFSGKLQNLMKHSLGNRVVFASCIMDGRCVTETAPASSAASEVKAMTKELLKLLSAAQENVSKAS